MKFLVEVVTVVGVDMGADIVLVDIAVATGMVTIGFEEYKLEAGWVLIEFLGWTVVGVVVLFG